MVTSLFQVMIPAKIFEYTSDGTFVREILVDGIDNDLSWFNTCHSIGRRHVRRLSCLYNSESCLYNRQHWPKWSNCYGGKEGSEMGQLNRPAHLAIDSDWIHSGCWQWTTTELYNSMRRLNIWMSSLIWNSQSDYDSTKYVKDSM